jgi:GNAT superfamily N-acetyltransferase
MSERIQVYCRPGRESDTADVIELTKTIWDGHDYVPEVWPKWLADPEGGMIVAEYEKRVIGLSKLSHIAEEDWWLQGLRVHPQYEGRGVASQLNDACLELWRRICSGVVRLATASFRYPVHHMCERSGFIKVGEYSSFVASAILPEATDPSKTDEAAFRPLTLQEIPEAVAFALASPSLALANGLIDMGWEWAPLRPVYMRRAIERQHAWWWRERQALLMTHLDTEGGEPAEFVVELLACPVEEIAACLLDFRRLAGALGFQRAVWMAALESQLAQPLQAAGFERDWDDALFLYAKEMV